MEIYGNSTSTGSRSIETDSHNNNNLVDRDILISNKRGSSVESRTNTTTIRRNETNNTLNQMSYCNALNDHVINHTLNQIKNNSN